MYGAMLHHPDATSYDISALRLCVSGGSAMPVELMRGFEDAFGCKVLEGYGLSETSPVASFNHPDRERKPGSIGTPIEGVEMKVVDDDGDEVAQGEVGEIVIRGHNVMKGYWNRPEATAEAIRDGWFHTRRHGQGRRGRLLLHRRPQEGPDHPRRLQRLPARDRGGPVRAPRRARGGRGRGPARRARRGGRRRGGAQGRRVKRRPRSCATSSRSRSPPTSTRGASGSSTSCRRARPARSSSARSNRRRTVEHPRVESALPSPVRRRAAVLADRRSWPSTSEQQTASRATSSCWKRRCSGEPPLAEAVIAELDGDARGICAVLPDVLDVALHARPVARGPVREARVPPSWRRRRAAATRCPSGCAAELRPRRVVGA